MRLTLSVLFASLFCPPAGAAPADLVRAWIEPRAPQVVWGQYAGQSGITLFGVGVRTEDRFTPASGWKIRAFSAVSLSPDGKRVAFKAEGANSSAIGIYRPAVKSAQVLDTACDARALIWSPNGAYLVVEDAQGLLNNTLRVVGYDDDSSEIEISGDVLSDLGYSAYRFRNEGRDGGKDVWRTQVYAAQWTSEHALAFKVKRVHLKLAGEGKTVPAGETPEERWSFDVLSRKFAKP